MYYDCLKYLRKELEFIEGQMAGLKLRLKRSPMGNLSVRKKDGRFFQFYLRDRKRFKKMKYLSVRKQMPLIKALAQKEYDAAQYMNYEELGNLIRQTITLLEAQRGDPALAALPEGCRALVMSDVVGDEEYAREWISSTKGGCHPYPVDSGFLTEKGELVRSKSEKIIADMLYYRGIPYVYEPELFLEEEGTIYPDFKILDVRRRREVYYEHFGMMGDAAYAERAAIKIGRYEDSGIWPGEGLLMSFESQAAPADFVRIGRMLDKYFG